jgi:NAD(P)-dependent dehydrogenase (short-subunit alcohol dehydrogenase family)
MTWAARAAAAVLDPTILFSFGRQGFELHRRSFRADDLDVDLRGKTALITGANSGLGRATALELARLGADTWLLCRDRGRGEEARAAIAGATGSARLFLERVDMSDLAAIRALVARLPVAGVDILVHNAGLMPATRSLTADGLELTVATHVVGPFLLTEILRPRLGRGARVIWVSSGGMYARKLDLAVLDGLSQDGAPGYDGMLAYAYTKRAQVVLAELWAERLRDAGVDVNAMHPGWADTIAVRTSMPRFRFFTRPLLRDHAQGADTIVWLAACARIAGATGGFWFDRERRRTHFLPTTREAPADRDALWAFAARHAGLHRG